jgi:hypothetical protein
MIDILYLTWNRREFTEASLATLYHNTDWSRVRRFVAYDDGSEDGARGVASGFAARIETVFKVRTYILDNHFRSPVAIANDFIRQWAYEDIFCKVDNDTMVPPGWLGECLSLMDRYPRLDLLGIEALDGMPCSADGPRVIQDAAFTGGIGLFRRRAFHGRPLPIANGRFGFGAWQEKHPELQKGWITPCLPVFLLNRLPFEPWQSLSAEYVRKGWQRPWPDPYTMEEEHKWGWWQG